MNFIRLGRTSKIHPQVQQYGAEKLTENITNVADLREFYSSQVCIGSNIIKKKYRFLQTFELKVKGKWMVQLRVIFQVQSQSYKKSEIEVVHVLHCIHDSHNISQMYIHLFVESCGHYCTWNDPPCVHTEAVWCLYHGRGLADPTASLPGASV